MVAFGLASLLLIFRVGSSSDITRAPAVLMSGCGQDERLAVARIEASADVAGQLDVLLLVLSDGHLVRVVEQNVRRLQNRVKEQGGADLLVFATGLVLELRHAPQLAVLRHRAEQPAELSVLTNVRLDEDDRLRRVQT